MVPSAESVLEPKDNSEAVLLSPKSSSLNLAGLKAAFSVHSNQGTRNPTNVSRAVSGGPTQKKLQSFFGGSQKGNTHRPNSHFPSRPTRDVLKGSPAGRSVLEGFRYGRSSDNDLDSSREGTLSECDSTTATPESLQGKGSEFNSPDATDIVSNPGTKNDIFDEHLDNEKPSDYHSEPYLSTSSTDLSPEAKKPKLEDDRFSSDSQDSAQACIEGSSGPRVDAPRRFQKRMEPLQFSVPELKGKVRRLQQRQRDRDEDRLRYRRFRAKINPGENQSAEDELKKEIRFDASGCSDY